jgi:hypothetical protein
VIAANPGVVAGILWQGSRPAGTQLHGDERAIERFLQRALDPRRRSEGKSTREAIRCPKRYLARQVWRLLQTPAPSQIDPNS